VDGNWVGFFSLPFFLAFPFFLLQAFLVTFFFPFNSSTSGFVNVYDSDSFSVHHGDASSVSGTPKLVKALGHLTTPISTLRFNHDAQILAMASKDKKDAMRLVGHLPLAFRLFRLYSFHCCTVFLYTSSVNRTTFTVGRRSRLPSFLAEPFFFSPFQLYFPEKRSFAYLSFSYIDPPSESNLLRQLAYFKYTFRARHRC
jgi:hypothetical protein